MTSDMYVGIPVRRGLFQCADWQSMAEDLMAFQDAVQEALGTEFAGHVLGAIARLKADRLAFDELAPGGTVYTDYDQAGEPIRHVMHRTHRGVPVWVCTDCLKVTVSGDDVVVCAGCGSDHLDADVSGPIVCADGAYECLLAGTDDCVCPDPDGDADRPMTTPSPEIGARLLAANPLTEPDTSKETR
ncbi:hypothetical protein ABT369_39265 [Dactylosporangium sp. NPDC000244]|uniref:hypothetical protein n=1 Tax=Dactylosporangium sp. NPDC000244 TaxID=3154365 RepID=UPI00332DD8EA